MSALPRLRYIRDRLRESFWFVPTLCACAAIALAVGLIAADRRVGDDLPGFLWLYSGSAEGARSLLAAVAGSIITVLGLAFSITTVALQLAAAQLGPRLLRNFVRDTGNQIVLGVFVGTFVFCLVVLRAIHGEDGIADSAFVPHLAVTGGVGLAMLSVGVLIYFIHHAAVSMQADHVIAQVAAELDGLIDTLFPARVEDGEDPRDGARVPFEPPPAQAAAAIKSRRPGYVQSVEAERLVALAVEHDLVVRLRCRAGDFVAEDHVLAEAWPAVRVDEAVELAVTGALVIGVERTMLQDVLFGFEQLVEIAVNGLSSGVRDPMTVVRCVDRLAAAVGRLADRALPSPYRRDDRGRIRVVLPGLSLGHLVDAAFGQIRAHARESARVSTRLLEAFTHLVTAHRRRDLDVALLEQAVSIVRGAERFDELDRDVVRGRFHDFVRHVSGDAVAPEARGLTAAPAA